jgi:hypothetical protein
MDSHLQIPSFWRNTVPLNEEQRTKVRAAFEKFVQNRIERVRDLRIKDFNINPFLFRILVSQMASVMPGRLCNGW